MSSSTHPIPSLTTQITWATHILSYLAPTTLFTSAEDTVEYEEQDVSQKDDWDAATNELQVLSADHEAPRVKFLNCIAELLSNSKGGPAVTATALRENIDFVEVDITRNGGFITDDAAYMYLLTNFLAIGHTIDMDENLTDCRFQLFLNQTIIYYAKRLDFWARGIIELMKTTSCRGGRIVSSGVQGQCSLFLDYEHTAAGALVAKLSQWDGKSSELRRDFVILAHATIRSPSDTREQLQALLPSAKQNKIRKILIKTALLARPITILRTLVTIVKLLPAFRTVRLIQLDALPPVLLPDCHQRSIEEAWAILDLSTGTHLPDVPHLLLKKAHSFRSNCSRPLTVHCEIQLLLRYEKNPSLRPTLSYFGCSKKACFLCDLFLGLSPFRPTTRGMHGVCHPNWAIPTQESSEALQTRLSQLLEEVKSRIKSFLRSRSSTSLLLVCQSTVLSELHASDTLGITQETADREKTKTVAEEERLRMRILMDPRSVIQYRIPPTDTNLLCVMCQIPRATRCTGCFAIRYCSSRCQSIDWPSHRLLCRRYLPFIQTRPAKHCRLGIWFPKERDKPRLVWIPYPNLETTRFCPYFRKFFGSVGMPLGTIPFHTNSRRGISLGYWITIYYPDFDETINKSARRAVEACQGMTTPIDMCGSYIVVSGQPFGRQADRNDITLTEFRHTLDYFSNYFDDTIYDAPRANCREALRISCPLHISIYGWETFTQVWVSQSFVSTSSTSDLATAILGYDIRICKIPITDAENYGKVGDSDKSNERMDDLLSALQLKMDPSHRDWGNSDQMFSDCSVILLRSDSQALDYRLAAGMCRYCKEILEPLFERSLRGEIPRTQVLGEIRPDKLETWIRDACVDPL